MPTEETRRPQQSSQARWMVPAGLVLLAGLAVGLVVGGGADLVEVAGIEGPGRTVTWGLPVIRLLAVAASVVTVGLLGYAAVLGPQGRKGVLSRVGRADVVRAGVVAGIWSVLSVATAAWALAWALGLPLTRTLTPDVIGTYLWSVDAARAWLFVAVIAAAIAIGCVFTATVTGAGISLVAALIGVALPALTGHSSSLGSHGVAMTSDVVHALAMSVWVGGVVAILFHGVRNDPGTMRALPVFKTVA
ncbi:MAG TPA: hypothetical protein PLT68_09720, partial [Actinomycetota bacterium]|nr:hypothetical protein [Actinomycetota bacterium]